MAEQDKVEKVRLDKWLWAARFFKTRSLAKDAVDGGKIQYNGQRCKPGKTVDVLAEVTVRQGWVDKIVIVRSVSGQRRNASLAQALYEETQASQVAREQKLAEIRAERESHPVSFKRPNKKDRRLIHRFRNNNAES